MGSMIRRGFVVLTTPLLAISLLGAATSPASAGTSAQSASAQPAAGLPFNYWVDATTTLKKLNQTVTVPRGTFIGSVDFSTATLTGSIKLPPATVPFKVAGLPLAKATIKIAEVQPVSGTLDLGSLEVTATSVFNIRIVKVTPIGLPNVNLVGDYCKTSKPVSVTMSGALTAGTFSGTYTLPPLAYCGAATKALNAVLPGPGNTFTANVTPM